MCKPSNHKQEEWGLSTIKNWKVELKNKNNREFISLYQVGKDPRGSWDADNKILTINMDDFLSLLQGVPNYEIRHELGHSQTTNKLIKSPMLKTPVDHPLYQTLPERVNPYLSHLRGPTSLSLENYPYFQFDELYNYFNVIAWSLANHSLEEIKRNEQALLSIHGYLNLARIYAHGFLEEMNAVLAKLDDFKPAFDSLKIDKQESNPLLTEVTIGSARFTVPAKDGNNQNKLQLLIDSITNEMCAQSNFLKFQVGADLMPLIERFKNTDEQWSQIQGFGQRIKLALNPNTKKYIGLDSRYYPTKLKEFAKIEKSYEVIKKKYRRNSNAH